MCLDLEVTQGLQGLWRVEACGLVELRASRLPRRLPHRLPRLPRLPQLPRLPRLYRRWLASVGFGSGYRSGEPNTTGAVSARARAWSALVG